MWTCLLFLGPDVQKTVNSSQLQFLDEVVVLVVVQRQVACPAVDATAGGASDSFIVKVFEV